MNEKIFLRSQELTDFWISERSKYIKKSSAKAFNKYILVLAEKEYKKTMEEDSCFDSDHYLETLISFLEELENMSADNVDLRDKNILLEKLVVTCLRPNLFFKKDSNPKSIHPKKTKQFEEEIEKLYKKWDTFINSLSLCQRYINRGTIDLDRSCPKPKLSYDEIIELAKQISDIYDSYYFTLKKRGHTFAYKPTIEVSADGDKNNLDIALIENCTSKPWLYPLAHILLIRDAQYKMMNKKKYKKMELLSNNSTQFPPDSSIIEAQNDCADITEYFACRIKDVLKTSILKRYRFLNQDRNEKKENYEQRSHCTSCELDKEQMNTIEQIFKSGSELSSVPYCSLDGIMLKVAKGLSLSQDNFQKLRDVLPALFWGKSPISKVLESIKLQSSEIESIHLKKQIEDRLDPLRISLDPNHYAPMINPDNCKVKNSKINKALKEFEEEIYFCDLTLPALFLSKAVQVANCPDDLLPSFLRHCKKNLRKALKQYLQEKYMKDLFQITQLDKDKLTIIEMSDCYSELRNRLSSYFTGIDKQGKTSWGSVKFFFKKIEELECRANMKTSFDICGDILNSLQMGENSSSAQIEKCLDEDTKKHLCYFAYSKLIDTYVVSLINRILEIIAALSLDIFHDVYSKQEALFERNNKSAIGTK